MEGIPCRELESVSFGICNPELIKKYSVVEINNPLTFDMLEHPVSGGLYDPHLGPNNQDELCESCGLRAAHCPGHTGHVTVPLPVFHPVFIKTLYQLLQGTCFKCHRLVAPTTATQVALYQFRALDYGLVGTVEQLSEAISDPSLISTDKGSTIEVSFLLQQKLKSIVDEAVAGLDLGKGKLKASVKSVVECRQRIVKEFLRCYFTNAKQKCPHCGAKKPKIALRHNSQFISNVGKKDSISVARKSSANTSLNMEDERIESGGNVSAVSEGNDTISNIIITPADAKKHLDIVWEKEKIFLQHLFGILRSGNNSCKHPISVFFVEYLMVPPSRFRPISVVKGRKYLNAQSTSLKNVLSDCLLLKNVIKVRNGEELADADMDQLQKLPGKTEHEKFLNLWHQLQTHVNCVYDSELDKLNKEKTFVGVKQILEKKEGLFRKHMMGKRVNFAARSVISPDPNIMVDEIGVPTVFAKKLTFPTPVTDWNVEKLRRAVINGPDVHPGADKIEMEDGRVVKLSSVDRLQRQAHACQLLTPLASAKGVYRGIPKKVHRHLENGDVLLLNRQPTLHKPSIMAHKVRVLPGERTLRLHYANCKSYNADFDGDEMNAHFPQNEVARSEGYNLVSVNHQYLVPKDGTPLSGLIQDHIIAGTLLTMRGKFFDKTQYQQLVYGAIAFKGKSVRLLQPTILKPQQLWSGKQIVSTIIINLIPEGKPPPTVEGKAKADAKYWQNAPAREWTAGGPILDIDMSESEVIIRSGELLCGVIDKAHIGPTPYGLIHCCYELYGGQTSSALLTALARLFTHFLQITKGFTLGYEDIELTHKATKNRRQAMRQARKVGDQVVAKAFDVGDPEDKPTIRHKFAEAHLSRDNTGLKTLDFEMKNATNSFNDDINKICTRGGLLKNFPSNNLQLMVQSGAKGALVNSTQISGALGQIELEGRRVPLMLNGSTAPSFLPYDTSPRAGGFVDGRFLTGIRCQEYFFHCMAGREGLIDTAVKTSRSGYLQRCLIKHLEGLVVNYDMTVRDSDGSVIQFLYGEDGLDISKMQLLKESKIHLLAENYASAINEDEVKHLKEHTEHSLMPSLTISEDAPEENLGRRRSHLFRVTTKSELIDNLETTTVYENKLNSIFHRKTSHSDLESQMLSPDFPGDPLNSRYRPDLAFGSIAEKLDNIIENYVRKKYLDAQGKKRKKRAAAAKILDMYYYRAIRALVQPGEAVGLLAAQSIGEPSTQMTLNTFHFAGRGEMNVTLGIPRLREILMVASASIATPTMDLPLLNKPHVEKEAEKLRIKLSSVSLKQVVQSIEISEIKYVRSRYRRFRRYVVQMTFCPHSIYKKKLYTSPPQILKYIENSFIARIIAVMKKKLAVLSATKLLTTTKKTKIPPAVAMNAENEHETQPVVMDVDDGATSDEGENDDDTVASKIRTRHNQELEYEEPESDENPDDPDFDEQNADEDVNIKAEIDSEMEIDDNEVSINMEDVLQENHSDEDSPLSEVEQKKARIASILKKYEWVQNYDYDSEEELWCEFTLQLCLEGRKIDIKTLLEEEASNAILYRVPNIKRAFLIKNPNSRDGSQMLKTDGVNFLEIFNYIDIIDTNKAYSNDIHAIAKIYGIEAAAKAIVKEIKNVFATYHIEVDPRHLLLIADYMTFDGTFRACNRIGMESNASPIQQMTFETTMNFLQTATLTGSEDFLRSPSAKLVVGQPVGVGTGCFDLLLKPDKAMTSKTN